MLFEKTMLDIEKEQLQQEMDAVWQEMDRCFDTDICRWKELHTKWGELHEQMMDLCRASMAQHHHEFQNMWNDNVIDASTANIQPIDKFGVML